MGVYFRLPLEEEMKNSETGKGKKEFLPPFPFSLFCPFLFFPYNFFPNHHTPPPRGRGNIF